MPLINLLKNQIDMVNVKFTYEEKRALQSILAEMLTNKKPSTQPGYCETSVHHLSKEENDFLNHLHYLLECNDKIELSFT